MLNFKESFNKKFVGTMKTIYKNLLRVFFCGTLLVLASCIRGPRTPDANQGSANTASDFRVSNFTAPVISPVKDNSWKVTTAMNYSLRACLIQISTSAQVPSGQKFRIQIAPKKFKDVETDNQGCIQWGEVLPFNFLADSVSVSYTHLTLPTKA